MRPSVLCFALLASGAIQAQIGEVIGLGEESHGFTSLNGRKAAVLLELITEYTVDALIVESSFVGSVAAQASDDALPDRMRGFMYPFWLTDTVVQAFAQAEKAAPAQPFLWGCDIQEDCRFHASTLQLIEHTPLKAWSADLLRCDSVLDRYIGASPLGRPLSAEDRLFVQGIYANIGRALDARQEHPVLQRVLLNRIQLCDHLALPGIKQRMALRDSLMAANVLWIREQQVSGSRCVLWAADRHVRHGMGGRPQWCGEYLDAALGSYYRAISVSHRRPMKGFDRSERVRMAVKLPPEGMVTPCP
ncbi:MAG: erythromycin esterase family protein [Flavobacteriales bacterium]